MLQNKHLKSLTGRREYHGASACCAPHPAAERVESTAAGRGAGGDTAALPSLCSGRVRAFRGGRKTFLFLTSQDPTGTGEGGGKIPTVYCEWLCILDPPFVHLLGCFISSFYMSSSGINKGFLKFRENGNHNYFYSLREESFPT